MKLITNSQDEALLTDSKGWQYSLEPGRSPDWAMPQIMNLIYETQLGEELTWEECLQLALYARDVDAWQDFTEDSLKEAWEECQDVFQGDFATCGDFAKNFFEGAGMVDEEATRHLVIDWEQTYFYSLQFDYFETFCYARNEAEREFEIVRYFWQNVQGEEMTTPLHTQELESQEGFQITLNLFADYFNEPNDMGDCYTPKQVEAFREDAWHFADMQIVITKAGVKLGEAWLGGFEYGYIPLTDEDDNLLKEVRQFGEDIVELCSDSIQDLTAEALFDAKATLERLAEA